MNIRKGDVVFLSPDRDYRWWSKEEEAYPFLVTRTDGAENVFLARIPGGKGPLYGEPAPFQYASGCHYTWVRKDEFLTAVHKAKRRSQAKRGKQKIFA